MADVLTSSQLAELRRRWVFDLVVAANPAATPPVAAVNLSVYNKRYGEQFFADGDLQILARRARKRWSAAIAAGIEESYTVVIHTAGGAGFGARPNGAALTLVSSDPTDVGIQVTLYGTTHGVAEVVSETVTLNGTTPVQTVKTNWDVMLAAVNALVVNDTILAVQPNGTVTIAVAVTGDQVTTLDKNTSQRGWNIAGMLVAGLPITAMVGSIVPEVGLPVYDDIVETQSDLGCDSLVGFVGVGPDGSQLLDFATLSGSTRVGPSKLFSRLDATLGGDVPEGVHITVTARDIGPYEGEELLLAGVQVLAFEAYLASDSYGAALEDKAEAVRRGWETRIASDMKKLQPEGRRSGAVRICR